MEEIKKKGWAIASLTTGILSIMGFIMPYFGLPLGIMAIVFNNLQKKNSVNGMGTAGFICGIIGIVINAIMCLLILMVLLMGYSMGEY